MRARLLDMGEVSAVRSQSLAWAVSSRLEPASDPVVVLTKPAAPVVSVGGSQPVAALVDLAFCRAERIPVVRSPWVEGARFHAASHLSLRLTAPAGSAAKLGLDADSGRWPESASRPLIAVCAELGLDARVGDCGRVEVAGRAIGSYEASQRASSVELLWEAFVGGQPAELETEARALAGPSGPSDEELVELLAATRTGFGAELKRPHGFAQIAEALVGAIEASFGLELVPSMPTPAEMDAVYDWDERLLVPELLDEPGSGGGGLTTYSM